MSTERASLPEPGEQITFEDGDCQGMKDRFVLRVIETTSGGMGMVTLAGWLIGQFGFPEGPITVKVSVATVEARRLHRHSRHRSQ